VLRGRGFDRSEAEAAVLINQRLASTYFPGLNPVGRRLQLGGSPAAPDAWFTIIGVASNIRQESTEGGEFDPIVYLSYQQDPENTAYAIARSALAPGAAARAIAQQISQVDKDLALFDIRSSDERIAYLQWAQRFAGAARGACRSCRDAPRGIDRGRQE